MSCRLFKLSWRVRSVKPLKRESIDVGYKSTLKPQAKKVAKLFDLCLAKISNLPKGCFKVERISLKKIINEQKMDPVVSVVILTPAFFKKPIMTKLI